VEKRGEIDMETQTDCIEDVKSWINSEDYKEKNFAREALVVNPAKACQPLGALIAALGFEGSLPFIHGSQGCAAYFRNNLSRHFREPVGAVSTSMTEDAAVFGGRPNLVEGIKNAYALYKPKMMPVFTTCMPEVIGDDLSTLINDAKKDESVPDDFPVPFANTPSFVGSHITGYDSMLMSIIEYLTQGKKSDKKAERINIISGFDTHIGNIREIKKILELFDYEYTLLSDNEMTLDSPNTGEFKMYPGGTSLQSASNSINSKATIALQQYSTVKTMKFIEDNFEHEALALPMPIGVRATDRLINEISRITGKPVPEAINNERGRAIDAITDAHQYIHGKRFALFGDPDIVIGVVSFLLEMGGTPAHVVCTNGTKKFSKEVSAMLESSQYGKECAVYAGKDLWHLRSLLMTDPVDMLIGSSYGKFAARDAGIPLVRIGYPIMDRVNLHRYPTIGYQGVINLLSWIVNTFLEDKDRTSDDAHFELLR
jgi:nitrogenase molybdenum-iron protein beta chain